MMKLSIIFILLGILCVVIESKFYQYVDENGVLHESLFMPIGAVLILLGGIGLVFSLAKKFAGYMGKNK